jgi:hypothetical protein
VQPSDSGYQPVGEPDILETTEYTTRVTQTATPAEMADKLTRCVHDPAQPQSQEAAG